MDDVTSSEDEHRIIFGGESGEGGFYDYQQDEEVEQKRQQSKPTKLTLPRSQFDPAGSDYSTSHPKSPFVAGDNKPAKISSSNIPTQEIPDPSLPRRTRHEWRRQEAIKSDFRWLYKQLVHKAVTPTSKATRQSEVAFGRHIDDVLDDEINDSADDSDKEVDQDCSDIDQVRTLPESSSGKSVLVDNMRSKLSNPLKLTPTGRAVVVDRLQYDQRFTGSSVALQQDFDASEGYSSDGDDQPYEVGEFELVKLLLKVLADLARCGAIPVYHKILVKGLVADKRPELLEVARFCWQGVVDLRQLQDYIIGIAWNM